MDSSRQGSKRTEGTFSLVVLYSTTIFLGSFLLFFLEPLFAKLILPWFGGSSSVWILCLVFFQGTLLLGYWYADVVTRRLSPLALFLLHSGLLLCCLWFLPITPGPQWRPAPGSDPTWLILGLLATQIGPPFFLLSSASPLLQVWYSRSLPGRKPYALFALSNAASLLALLCFPFLAEPNFSLSKLVLGWSGAFVLYAILCAWAAWNGSRQGPHRRSSAPARPGLKRDPIPLRERSLWVGLSACGSILLLSITNHLLRDVAAVPLLWVLPLSLYLLSFVLVFADGEVYPRKWMPYVLAVVLVFLNYAFYDPAFILSLELKILVACAGLFAGCFFCHGELANRQPSPVHLTSYYLMISLGGALGSVLVGVVAPQIFPGLYEYPLALTLTALAGLVLGWPRSQFHRVFWGVILLFLLLVFGFDVRALRSHSIVMTRNFYAALRVVPEKTRGGMKYLTLCHGVVIHGKQFLDPADRTKGTAYYGPASGAALAIRSGGGAKKIGVIGLGAGTLAVYGGAGDVFRFYEIDPQVIRIAGSYFTFLRDSRAKIELVPGDARLSLGSESPNQFDVLAVDAFSGDAIPAHLLTREAFRLYERHVKPGGILAFHTSNLHLNLALVVQTIAREEGYTSLIVGNLKDEERLIDVTEWVLVTKNEKVIRAIQALAPGSEEPLPGKLRAWTDDYSGLFSVIR